MAQLVFVDLETTGLDVERHGIIEIACIFETDGNRAAEGLHSLVNPGGVEHTEAAAAVHKIPREAIDAARRCSTSCDSSTAGALTALS